MNAGRVGARLGRLGCGVPLLLASALGLAQAPREESVLVSARVAEELAKSPSPVTVITREEIARLPARTLGEVLQLVPGVTILLAGEEGGGAPMAQPRGLFGGGEVEKLRLVVDGVPAGDVESGLVDWRALRAEEIERVEVLRGPSAWLWGDASPGGVVAVFTRRAAGGSGLGAAAAVGSFGTVSAEAVARAATGRVSLGVSGGASRTSGFRAHAAGTAVDGGAVVAIPAGGGVLRFSASGERRDREDPGVLTLEELERDPRSSEPAFASDRDRSARGRAAAAWEREGEGGTLRATLSGSLRNGTQVRTLLFAPGASSTLAREVQSGGGALAIDGERRVTFLGRPLALRATLESGRDRLATEYRTPDAGEPVASRGGRRDHAALALGLSWDAAPRVTFAAALRGDAQNDRFDGSPDARSRALSGRGGVVVRAGPAAAPVDLRLLVSRDFAAPTLDQLYDPRPFPDFRGGTFTLSNPALAPERAWTVQAGVSVTRAIARGDLVVYASRFTDEIDFDAASFRYRNLGSSRHAGVEASLRLLPSAPVSPLLAGSYRSATSERRQLKNIPRWEGRGGVLFSAGDLSGAALVHVVGGRFLDDSESLPLRDVVALQIRASLRIAAGSEVALDADRLGTRRAVAAGYVLGGTAYVVPDGGPSVRLLFRAGL